MVQRFDNAWATQSSIVEDCDGGYVLYEDYRDLQKQYDKVIDKLREATSGWEEGRQYWLWRNLDND